MALLEASPPGIGDGAGLDGARPVGHEDLAVIEAELAAARARVSASIHALGDEVARRADWRAWVRERPTLVLAGAFVVGCLLGQLGGAPHPDSTRRSRK